ncbi:bifunctional riboflavin kinase/FAD synthetase [Lysinibacillus sp. 2017]|uniref:riboflavin biosynthesis protein RibF n=1 Tax=unclassified Lysinibacillus TaxID=2636778 RepID=UPI000D52A087|nr:MULTISPECIES: riboflavin biosynthesis protein RibF [unclassified Lysinibacillus]AWE06720.1 bifunctional riboflavin kinase/FAD synthetase [Lysinibacillus sp. 2017]TGN37347.1 riboflavin biosynthesis protein RibF [Lysinibacillus sp. S2017]
MNVIHLKYPHQLAQETNKLAFSLAVGFFDGVHKGHQAVINSAKEKAQQLGVQSAVMTFDPHPSIVLGRRNEKVFYITPLTQKLDTLKKLNVDTVFVVNFTSDFAKLTPEEFIKHFILDLNVKHVTAGFDFSFGAFGKGNMETMKQLSNGQFGVTIVEKQADTEEKISSTRIRNYLQDGQMEQVRTLLGRAFEVPGIVVHGDKRGRTMGFPTANVQAMGGCYIPATGVYAVKILVQNEWYNGVCNVGYKPTFKNPDEKQLSIEVHILNFDKNIYGEEVVVGWYKRIRSERKFDGINALIEQIELDKQEAIEYFNQLS